MKKATLVLAAALAWSGANAQGLVSKKGEPYLPQAGDWALGIEANPFLQYIGNFFGKTTTNASPGNNFLGRQVIIGKYFVDSLTAYRGGLRLGIGSNTARMLVDELPASTATTFPYPELYPQVENSWKTSETNIGLTGGMEMRRGKTRLQGYYGGELGIFFSSTRETFEYGNALSTNTAAPVNVSGGDSFTGAGNINTTPGIPGVIGSARLLERKSGATFIFGIRGFVGVEYFILPKISVGGEFGWGIGLGSTGTGSETWESVGNKNAGGSNEVGETVIETPKTGGFFVDTDNNNSFFGTSGALRLNFHF